MYISAIAINYCCFCSVTDISTVIQSGEKEVIYLCSVTDISTVIRSGEKEVICLIAVAKNLSGNFQIVLLL